MIKRTVILAHLIIFCLYPFKKSGYRPEACTLSCRTIVADFSKNLTQVGRLTLLEVISNMFPISLHTHGESYLIPGIVIALHMGMVLVSLVVLL